ncbi:helix-turn-helix transcriptional regulator [Xylanibacillus composti]|nr:HTH domain-containing protein [Xylanibacillus composti]
MEMRQPDVSTKQTILHILKTQGAHSVGELAVQLGVTEMAVRRHIQSLEKDGFLQSAAVKLPKGRPLHRYMLAPEADKLFPKNYNVLALDLLEELEQEDSAMVERLFERRKARLAERYTERMKGKTLSEKVTLLAQIQDESGYMVRVHPDEEGGYTLVEHNCPISHVAYRYQQACRCELQLFRQLLDSEVERTECLAKGGQKCSYQIRPRRVNT